MVTYEHLKMTSITNSNHASYRKLYFTEFVQNSLRFNMGIVFFKKRHERVDLLRKVFNKILSATSKTL